MLNRKETQKGSLLLDFYSRAKPKWLSQHIRQISIDEFEKCSNIWDMKKCPFTEQFRNELINKNRFIYVLEVNGQFIAEGALVLSSNEAGYTIENQRIYLSRLMVKKEYRNIGLGQFMLGFLINKAKALGYSELSVGVDCENKNAMHIYRKNDFEVFEQGKDEYGEFYKMLKRL